MNRYIYNNVLRGCAVMAFLLAVLTAAAQDVPTISPVMTVTEAPDDDSGQTADGSQTTSYTGSAPVTVRCESGAEGTEGWTASYEWHFFHDNDTTAYLIRYDETTEFTFRESGTHRIQLWATFTRGSQRVEYGRAYYSEEGGQQLTVSVSESQLEFPNTFTPNGDGFNDTFHAKSGYKSIVDFHAYVFNRWGQKLYSWDSPAGGWDGTYKGRPVKEGVYFLLVEARGADGRKFNIKKDINLLRGYTEEQTTNEE